MKNSSGFAFILCVSLFLVHTGCSNSEPPPSSESATNSPPPLPSSTDTQKPTSSVSLENNLAIVLNTGITMDDARNALRRMTGPPIAKTAVMLAAGRVLAVIEAERSGMPRAENENNLDYVDRFLALTFSERTSCASISEEEIAERFRIMRRRYDHPDIFKAINLQFICCPSSRAPCVNDKMASLCFKEERKRAEEIFSELLMLRTHSEAFAQRAKSLAESHEQIGAADLKFAYDYDFDRHDQPGPWAILDPAILSAVRKAAVGDVIGPIQSEYGFHILYIQKHDLKTKRTLDEPDVHKEVRNTYCQERLKSTREQYLLDLTRSVKVQINPIELAKFKKEVESKRKKRKQPPKRSLRKTP